MNTSDMYLVCPKLLDRSAEWKEYDQDGNLIHENGSTVNTWKITITEE